MLASASPQRAEILRRLGIEFRVRVSSVPETHEGDPARVTVQNARRKAVAVRRETAHEAILGCDTAVALEGALYGKPADATAALATLRALAGRTHEVVSGLVLLLAEEERTAVAHTAVTFRELDEELLAWYVSMGEWRGRAGGYAIQGAGAALVRAVRGGYENVVGLPLPELLDLCPRLLVGS
ncbi:MAG TPA: nucleoside triphosphate pyrophosphatase [Solirubrobacteraceae bacterium]|nr:nucleoside triphosphate pyrophosphatase [Solirubrobacteraceae bacterium]